MSAVELLESQGFGKFSPQCFLYYNTDQQLCYNLAGARLLMDMQLNNEKGINGVRAFSYKDQVQDFALDYNVPYEAVSKFESRMRLLEQFNFAKLLELELIHPHFYSAAVTQFDSMPLVNINDNPAKWRMNMHALIKLAKDMGV